jgi:hypothetical protein
MTGSAFPLSLSVIANPLGEAMKIMAVISEGQKGVVFRVCAHLLPGRIAGKQKNG